MVASPKRSDELSKDFLYHLLRGSDLSSTISGAAQPQITRQSLAPFQIPLPPLSEQEALVAEVEGYQREIEDLKKQIAAREELIKKRVAAVWGEVSEPIGKE